MKCLLNRVAAALLFSAVSLPLSYAYADLDTGDHLPQWKEQFLNVNDKMISLDSAKRENGLLVVFTCNHCPFVKKWESRYTEFGNSLMKKGIGVIAVNSNDPEKQPQDGIAAMRERHRKLGMRFPYVVDASSELARTFGAERTPEFFLFDRDGKLIYKGAFDDNAENAKKVREAHLKNAVNAYLAHKPIAKPETKSVGCGIKFREKTRTKDRTADVY